jgi:hypothetical protein
LSYYILYGILRAGEMSFMEVRYQILKDEWFEMFMFKSGTFKNRAVPLW